jgi:mycofactocin precursor
MALSATICNHNPHRGAAGQIRAGAANDRRRSTVSSDTSPARCRAGDTAQNAGKTSDSGDIGATEELLVEEVSIDGMCGVY